MCETQLEKERERERERKNCERNLERGVVSRERREIERERALD